VEHDDVARRSRRVLQRVPAQLVVAVALTVRGGQDQRGRQQGRPVLVRTAELGRLGADELDA